MTNVLRELIEAAEAAIREFFDPTAELIQRHNKMRVLSSVIAAYKSALTPTPTDRECAEAVINLWAKESFDSLILDKDWVQTAATGKAMAESKCVAIIAAHVAARLATERGEKEKLREMVENCIELLDTSYLRERVRTINAPEDQEVRQLCDRIGYGAVMDSACRQWCKIADNNGMGAHTTGHCFGTIESLVKKARALQRSIARSQ